MRGLALLLLLLSSVTLFSQKEGNVWYTCYFRDLMPPHASFLDFNQGPPQITYYPNSPLQMESRESTTSVCDEYGNLLFFSNGTNIYDRNRDILSGWVQPNSYYSTSTAAAQGNLLLPVNDSIYFAFVIVADTPTYTAASYYSTINRNLNQGLGQVTATHQFVEDSLTEAMSAVRHANGESWWVLWHEAETNVFLKMLIDPSGVTSISRQAVGFVIPNVNGTPLSRITFSEQGDRFAIMEGEGRTGIYDFNRCTGEIFVRDSIIKAVIPNQTFNGLSFSPSGKYLYTNDVEPADHSYLYQYCLDSSNLLSSEILIHEFDNTGSSMWKMFFSSKLAPDGKIYLTHDWLGDGKAALDSLSIIEYPDSHGLACGFNLTGLPMTGSAPSYIPPNIPNYRLGPLMAQPAEAGPAVYTCPGDPVQIGVADTTGNMTFEWVPFAGLDDPYAPQPMAAPGITTTYYLMATDTTLPDGCNTTEDSVTVNVIDTTGAPQIELGPDTIVCQGDSLLLTVPYQPDWFYNWSSGNTTSSQVFDGFQSQTVTLQVWDTLAGGYYTCRADWDSIYVEVEEPVVHNAPEAQTFCPGEVLTVGVPSEPGFEYRWEPTTGLQDPFISQTIIQPEESQLFTLTVTDPNKLTENCRSLEFPVPLVSENCILQNVMTPNGDGINDVLDLGTFANPPRLNIYDRWGHLVFHDDAYGNDWTGSDLPEGTYYYVLQLKNDPSGAKQGYFDLLR